MRKVILFLLLLSIILVGCSNSTRFDAGTPLTAEELAALQAQLDEQKNNPNSEQGNEQENEKTPTNGMVFWLSGGSVYHLSATCYHISEKQGVLSGTVNEAQAAGKSRACSSCADD